jgi:predicted phage tail component-like protein
MILGGKTFSELGLILLRTTEIPILPSTTDRMVQIPGRAGAYDFGSDIGPRQFNLECAIKATTTRQELVEKARALAVHLLDDGKPKTMELIFDDEPDRYYNVRYSGRILMEKIASIGRFTLPLIASDPFAYAIIPLSIPIATDTPGTAMTFSIGGTVTALPRITLKGTNLDGSYQITVNGTAFLYSGALTADDMLVIDCAKYAVLKNGARDMMHFAGRFPRLMPGKNTIYYHLNADATLTALNVDVRERWF